MKQKEKSKFEVDIWKKNSNKNIELVKPGGGSDDKYHDNMPGGWVSFSFLILISTMVLILGGGSKIYQNS